MLFLRWLIVLSLALQSSSAFADSRKSITVLYGLQGMPPALLEFLATKEAQRYPNLASLWLKAFQITMDNSSIIHADTSHSELWSNMFTGKFGSKACIAEPHGCQNIFEAMALARKAKPMSGIWRDLAPLAEAKVPMDALILTPAAQFQDYLSLCRERNCQLVASLAADFTATTQKYWLSFSLADATKSSNNAELIEDMQALLASADQLERELTEFLPALQPQDRLLLILPCGVFLANPVGKTVSLSREFFRGFHLDGNSEPPDSYPFLAGRELSSGRSLLLMGMLNPDVLQDSRAFVESESNLSLTQHFSQPLFTFFYSVHDRAMRMHAAELIPSLREPAAQGIPVFELKPLQDESMLRFALSKQMHNHILSLKHSQRMTYLTIAVNSAKVAPFRPGLMLLYRPDLERKPGDAAIDSLQSVDIAASFAKAFQVALPHIDGTPHAWLVEQLSANP